MLDLPDRKPILEYNRGSQAGEHSNGGQHNPDHDKTGNFKGYRVGDILDVNCTSPRSKPPAILKWYINNEMVRIKHTA